MRAWFPELQIVLLDDDEPIAAGWGVPIAWDGSVADLPTRYTDSLGRAVRGRELGVVPDALVICAGVVLQGRVIAAAPRSQTFTASVSRWEEWTDLPMPTSGAYVIPGAPALLDVDRERDVAVMVESNIWVQHRWERS